MLYVTRSGAVSYTHLDVYKRQDLSQKFDELMAIPEAFFEDRTILDLIANPWKGQDPVYDCLLYTSRCV